MRIPHQQGIADPRLLVLEYAVGSEMQASSSDSLLNDALDQGQAHIDHCRRCLSTGKCLLTKLSTGAWRLDYNMSCSLIFEHIHIYIYTYARIML